ncbi:hypothetical protein, partial [Rhizomonospora bruguierae]|uniref:hypothetical protein n=1 Tax=Rhizomonospora bruguierae TaxID=1581705 RepID=UPI001BCB7472
MELLTGRVRDRVQQLHLTAYVQLTRRMQQLTARRLGSEVMLKGLVVLRAFLVRFERELTALAGAVGDLGWAWVTRRQVDELQEQADRVWSRAAEVVGVLAVLGFPVAWPEPQSARPVEFDVAGELAAFRDSVGGTVRDELQSLIEASSTLGVLTDVTLLGEFAEDDTVQMRAGLDQVAAWLLDLGLVPALRRLDVQDVIRDDLDPLGALMQPGVLDPIMLLMRRANLDLLVAWGQPDLDLVVKLQSWSDRVWSGVSAVAGALAAVGVASALRLDPRVEELLAGARDAYAHLDEPLALLESFRDDQWALYQEVVDRAAGRFVLDLTNVGAVVRAVPGGVDRDELVGLQGRADEVWARGDAAVRALARLHVMVPSMRRLLAPQDVVVRRVGGRDVPLVTVSAVPPRVGLRDGLGVGPHHGLGLADVVAAAAAQPRSWAATRAEGVLGWWQDRLPPTPLLQEGVTLYVAFPWESVDVRASLDAGSAGRADRMLPELFTRPVAAGGLAVAWRVTKVSEGGGVTVLASFPVGTGAEDRARLNEWLVGWFADRGRDVWIHEPRPPLESELIDGEGIGSEDSVRWLSHRLRSRFAELVEAAGPGRVTLTDEEYERLRDEWVGVLANRAGVPVPRIEVDADLPAGAREIDWARWTFRVSTASWREWDWASDMGVFAAALVVGLALQAAADGDTPHQLAGTPLDRPAPARRPADWGFVDGVIAWDGGEDLTSPDSLAGIAADRAVHRFRMTGVVPGWESRVVLPELAGFTASRTPAGVDLRAEGALGVFDDSFATWPLALPGRLWVTVRVGGAESAAVAVAVVAGWLDSLSAGVADSVVVEVRLPDGQVFPVSQMGEAALRLGGAPGLRSRVGAVVPGGAGSVRWLAVRVAHDMDAADSSEVMVAGPMLVATGPHWSSHDYFVFGVDGLPGRLPLAPGVSRNAAGELVLDGVGGSAVTAWRAAHGWVDPAEVPRLSAPLSRVARLRGVFFPDPVSHSGDEPAVLAQMDGLMEFALRVAGQGSGRVDEAAVRAALDGLARRVDMPVASGDAGVAARNWSLLTLYRHVDAVFDQPSVEALLGMRVLVEPSRPGDSRTLTGDSRTLTVQIILGRRRERIDPSTVRNVVAAAAAARQIYGAELARDHFENMYRRAVASFGEPSVDEFVRVAELLGSAPDGDGRNT